jgi:hypothetical protein
MMRRQTWEPGVKVSREKGRAWTSRFVLIFLLMSMLAQMAKADGGIGREASGSRSGGSSLTFGEFLCGVAGGTATGVVLKNAGAGDPVTFFGALLGGVIGTKFCRYLNDDVAQGLQRAARSGLEGGMCQQTRWSSGGYHGTLEILGESWSKANPREAAFDSICKLFETTIYERPKRFLGRSKVWACRNSGGDWIVTEERWVATNDIKLCRQTSPQGPENRLSAGAGGVPSPIKIQDGRVQGFWSLDQFRRRANDFGVERGLLLAVRTEFPGQVEVGFMKAVSDDGRGVIVYISPQYQRIVNIDQVGIECRASQLCSDNIVETADGIKGTLLFIFKNGDVVINDPMNGFVLRPGLSIRSVN